MPAYCVAVGCSNARGKLSCAEKTFFRFPVNDKELLTAWTRRLSRSHFTPSRYSVLCSDHFKEECFVYQPFTGRRQLKKGSIPTKFRFVKKNTKTTDIDIPSSEDEMVFEDLTLAAAAADPQSESYSPQSSETLSVVKSIIASAKPSKSRKPVKAAPLKPVELTRLESSESILPDLCVPAWSDKPTGKTYLKQNLSSATSSNASTSTSTIDTVNSEATFLSTFKVEPEDDSIAELFDDSVMDTPPESLWEFHPALRSLSWLIGCWRSITGFASYPTMETVPYREEMQFFGTMQPVLQYKSETWHSETQKLMHCESGFLRIDPGSKMVAFMVAHNFGVAELSEGTLGDQPMLMLKSKSISRMSFTKNASVTEIVRSFELKGNVLTSEVSMATVTQPLQKHLVVKYAKVL